MTKLEKVIAGLQRCCVDNCTGGSKCPYNNNSYVDCVTALLYDALDVVEERVALYHEIKAQWNLRRQMPDASGEELKFLVGLLDRMEADEPEPPKEEDV